MAVVNLDIDEETLVTEVADKVVVIEDKEDIACPKKITSIAPTIPANKIRLTLIPYTELPKTEATTLITAENLTENII